MCGRAGEQAQHRVTLDTPPRPACAHTVHNNVQSSRIGGFCPTERRAKEQYCANQRLHHTRGAGGVTRHMNSESRLHDGTYRSNNVAEQHVSVLIVRPIEPDWHKYQHNRRCARTPKQTAASACASRLPVSAASCTQCLPASGSAPIDPTTTTAASVRKHTSFKRHTTCGVQRRGHGYARG